MNGIRIDSRLTQWIRLCRYCKTIGMNRLVGVRIIERFLQLIKFMATRDSGCVHKCLRSTCFHSLSLEEITLW